MYRPRLSRVLAINYFFICSAQTPRHPREDCSTDYSPCNSAHGHGSKLEKSSCQSSLGQEPAKRGHNSSRDGQNISLPGD
ncbi:hypothetical protein RRG08_025275 [Elysia crispata]|uniref:Uncharacterized protein n=1 Tax=Elysia crispata TaxID=231223 RepID=A0AAE1AA37_9GAST|nr:hypothetical protein RRG08_025275 [Elysia crispata]